MKRAIIAILVVAVLVAGGIVLARRLHAEDPADETQYKVTTVSLGSVKKSVSATGTLQAWRVIDIKSKAGGKVLKLYVDVGSVVKKGQRLAEIDPTDTLLTVNTAKADIDTAKARIAQTDATYQLQVQQSEIAVRNAEAALEAAIASRNVAAAQVETARANAQAQPEITQAAIETAQANLNQAIQQRAALDATNPQELATAKAAYDQAVANARNAHANFIRQQNLLARGFVSQQVVDAAQAADEVAAAQVSQAKKKLDTVQAELAANVAAADARVKQAQAQLDNAKAGMVDIQNRKYALQQALAALKQADAQVAASRELLRQAKANRANNIIRKLDVAQAKASIERANATMVNAKSTLDQTVVTAPSDGVILKKLVDEGTIVPSALSFAASGNTLLQLGDVSRMYVDTTVDETDIANVSPGQHVDISMDAYPGIPFEGKVIRIDPSADVIQNVTMFHVRVELDNSSPMYALLKPGMNATCEFVHDKKDDVIAVPNEAVHTDDRGQYVEIASGGKPYIPAGSKTPPDPDTLVQVKPIRRDVQVGLEGNDTTEITGGLKVGERIITQKIEPAPKTAGSPFGGRMFGGGGGRR